jgi:hypothetical protein
MFLTSSHCFLFKFVCGICGVTALFVLRSLRTRAREVFYSGLCESNISVITACVRPIEPQVRIIYVLSDCIQIQSECGCVVDGLSIRLTCLT